MKFKQMINKFQLQPPMKKPRIKECTANGNENMPKIEEEEDKKGQSTKIKGMNERSSYMSWEDIFKIQNANPLGISIQDNIE